MAVEQLVAVDGGEDCRRLGRAIDVVGEVRLDAGHGPGQPGVRVRIGPDRLELVGDRPAQEDVVGAAAVLVGAEVR